MHKIIISLAFSVALHSSVYSQDSLPGISLNHIYIVLDSATYEHLFDSAFIEEKLGNVKAKSVTTTADSWSGKYLFGKSSYFELFTTNSFEGAKEGSCGLGFITAQSGDIRKIEKYWRTTGGDAIQMDTSSEVEDGKSRPWYYALYSLPADSTEPLSVWLMENTPEELRSVGYSDAEIKQRIDWQQYTVKRNKQPFTKCFDYIQSVTLSVSESEYTYLKNAFTGFGLQQQDSVFFNDRMKITCTPQNGVTPILNQVEIKLTQPFEKRTIKISEHLSVVIKDDTATWMFR